MGDRPKLLPVAAQDVDELARLWYDGWHAGHADLVPAALTQYRDLDSFRVRIMRDRASFFLSKDGPITTGFIRIVGSELDQFYVAPSMIGQGVAAPLIEAAEAQMGDMGVTRAHLIAAVKNIRAIRFYEKHGWANCGARMETVATVDGTFKLEVVRLEKVLLS